METPRRTFLAQTSAALIVSSLPQSLLSLPAQTKVKPKKEEPEDGVSTNEDLMREHGS